MNIRKLKILVKDNRNKVSIPFLNLSDFSTSKSINLLPTKRIYVSKYNGYQIVEPFHREIIKMR